MKQICPILLSVMILMQPLCKVWIVVSFKINQKEIAETLCSKRDFANNTCQGMCHLKKQIDKVDEQEKKQVPTSQKDKIETLYCAKISPFLYAYYDLGFEEQKSSPNSQNDYIPTDLLTDIFHPPKYILI